MPDDDRELMERLAALEAEVKAEHDAKRAKVAQAEKAAALARAEKAAVLEAQAEKALVAKARVAKARPVFPDGDDLEEPRPRTRGDLGNAIELASRAEGVRQELARVPKEGEKSWVKAGLASMLLGPLGWLYAGSLREAIPASAAYLALAVLLAKISIPSLLLMPVILVALPLSGIAGAIYAVQYNRTGKRQRLFGDTDDTKSAKKGKKPKLLP